MSETRNFVLNCNDDDAGRYLMTRLLQQAGYEVREARNGREALALAALAPSLVVLDINLPDMSGLEVCRQLKANPATAAIPVLQTSATFISSARRVEGLESGADGYLTQPVEAPVLTATVRALLRARQAEDKVREAALMWHATFDAIADGVATVDDEGRVMQANASMLRLLHRTASGVVGESLERLLADAFDVPGLSLLPAALRAHARQLLEVPSGGRWFRVSADPLPEHAGHGRLVVTVADITDLKRVEDVQRQRAEDLLEADGRKDEFLAMLAHELRNPLNAIATANSLQERVGAQDPQNMRLRSMVSRQTRHLARLVDDLLEVSRITRGQIQLHYEPSDLRTALRQAIQSTLPQVEAKHQQLTMQLPPDPVYVNGDLLRLEQVMVNIIGNASKYSATEGHISIKCEIVPGGVAVRVKDDGVGIPADRLGTVFDLFVQIDRSLARSVGGLGIGLTIARRLVELHGGSIVAQSDGIGRGSEFVVTLPVVETGPATLGRIPPIAARTSASPALDVLLIEDNADTRELMRSLVESWGHRVTTAADGTSGLTTALDRRPDVALIDVGLPGIDGYEVAQNLRSSEAGRGMLLVALTGYGRPEDRARALESGFDLHLVKPVQAEKLQTILADPPMLRHSSTTQA